MCSGSPPPFLPAARGCGVLLLRNRVALIICAHRLGFPLAPQRSSVSVSSSSPPSIQVGDRRCCGLEEGWCLLFRKVSLARVVWGCWCGGYAVQSSDDPFLRLGKEAGVNLYCNWTPASLTEGENTAEFMLAVHTCVIAKLAQCLTIPLGVLRIPLRLYRGMTKSISRKGIPVQSIPLKAYITL